MEECAKCGKIFESSAIVEAIDGSEIVRICEECSLSENLPVIRKPTDFQLQESVKPYSVRDRLSRMAGIKVNREKKEQMAPRITLENLRKPKDYSGILDAKYRQVRKTPNLGLIDNWNWHIQMARRNRKLTVGQVAGVIGENEQAVKLIEAGNLGDDSYRIIGKLEQYLKINLRKSENQKEAERIEAVKIPVKTSNANATQPVRVLNFDKETLGSLTISDLKRMKEEKEKDSKIEEKTESFMSRVWKGIEKREEKKEVGMNSGEDLVGSDVEFLED